MAPSEKLDSRLRGNDGEEAGMTEWEAGMTEGEVAMTEGKLGVVEKASLSLT